MSVTKEQAANAISLAQLFRLFPVPDEYACFAKRVTHR